MADERHRPVIVDDLHGVELYATEVSGFTLAHGNVTLTLSSLRASWDDEGIPNKTRRRRPDRAADDERAGLSP